MTTKQKYCFHGLGNKIPVLIIRNVSLVLFMHFAVVIYDKILKGILHSVVHKITNAVLSGV
jgi:hypothetical protein